MVLYSPTVTGSLTLAGGTITVSGSSINNLTASFATTASFALNAGGGAGFPFIGAGNITGSLVISSSNASSSLVLRGSGSGVFTVDGTSGRLFSVDDSLSGSLFSVNTIAGLPVIEAFSDNTVRIGQYNKRALFVSQSVVGINKETALNGVLDISGSVAVSGSILVSGSITTNGTITAQTLVVQTITSSITYSSGSNIFGNSASNNQIFTGSVLISGSLRVSGSSAITGSIELTGPVYSVGENRMSQGVFNDPVPNINAALKISTIPAASLLTTAIGARISGSATSNFDTYAGYFNNISTVSGTGMAYGIFASGSFHNFGGETRFYQGTFNDPINGTAASVKISAIPVASTPTAVFTVGLTGAASSGQNTFAGYFRNTSTVSGGGVNYGIYAIGTNHYFSGSVGIGTASPSERLEIYGIAAATSSFTGLKLTNGSDGGLKILFSNNVSPELASIVAGVTAAGAGTDDGTLIFSTATNAVSSEKVRITNGGNVGIGTNNPLARLHVGDGTQSAINGAGNKIHIASATSAGRSALVTLANSSGAVTVEGQFESSAESADLRVIIGSTSNHDVVLRSNNVERMRITSGSGLVGINTSNPNARLDLGSGYGGNGEKFLIYNDDTSGALAGTKMGFYIDRFSESNSITFVFPYAPASTSRYHIAYKDTSNTTLVDLAYLNYNSTAWVFPSDERMKNVEGIIPNALDKIKDLRAVYYTQKRDPEQKRKVGLLAQDLLKVLPEVVDVPDTELDSEGNQRYMSVALADTIPLLLKAIQELKAEFDEYKSTHP